MVVMVMMVVVMMAVLVVARMGRGGERGQRDGEAESENRNHFLHELSPVQSERPAGRARGQNAAANMNKCRRTDRRRPT